MIGHLTDGALSVYSTSHSPLPLEGQFVLPVTPAAGQNKRHRERKKNNLASALCNLVRDTGRKDR